MPKVPKPIIEALYAVLLATSLAACPIEVSSAFSSERGKAREDKSGSEKMGKPARTSLEDLSLTVV